VAELVEQVTEIVELRLLEKQIKAGLEGMISAGTALAEIRDRRLYKQTHHSFDAYCLDRWGFTRHRADQLIGAASTVGAMVQAETPPRILPTHETLVRPLQQLPTPEAQADAWDAAVSEAGGGIPTAKQVAAAVEKRQPKLLPTIVGTTATVIADDAQVPSGATVTIESIDRSGNTLTVRAEDGKTTTVFRSEIEPHEFAPPPTKKSPPSSEYLALKSLLKTVWLEVGEQLSPALREQVKAAISE
jgi:hypothetical protein